MNLRFIFIFCTVLNGCFCKRQSWKRSAHKTSTTSKVSTSTNDINNFVENFSNRVIYSQYPNNSTNFNNLTLTAEGDLNHSSNNLKNSTNFGNTLLTSTIDPTFSERSFTTFTRTKDNYTKANSTSTSGSIFRNTSLTHFNKSEDDLTTAKVDLKRSSVRPANLIDFISDLLRTEVDLNVSNNSFPNCTDVLKNLTALQIYPNSSDRNTAVEDVELSGIIIYAPKEVKTFQQTLFKKFQKFLTSFFLNLEQNRMLNSSNGDNNSDTDENNVKLNGRAFESSKAIEMTKGTDEGIQSSVKQTVAKDGLLSQDYDKENEIVTSQTTVTYTKTATPSKRHLVDHTENVQNNSINEHKSSIKYTQPLEKEEGNQLIPTISETLLKLTLAKTIDKNTKYFLGEGSTESDSASSIYRTIEEDTSNVTSNRNDRQRHKFNNTGHFKKKNHSGWCTEKGGNCLHDKKESPTINFELQSAILEATKARTFTSRDSRQKATGSTSTLDYINDHSQTTDEDSFKMNVREDFFKYKDWLWQHIEDVKNLSLKSNSTENFLNAHHFLLNSGGTDKSATDASESNSFLLENKSDEPEMKSNIYKLLLEEDLNQDITINSNVPLKRFRRIKRSPKNSRKQLNEEVKTEAITIKDEVTLPDAENDSTFQTNTDTASTEIKTTLIEKASTAVDPSDITVDTTSTMSKSESEMQVTSATEIITTILDTTTTMTTFESEISVTTTNTSAEAISIEETPANLHSQNKGDSNSIIPDAEATSWRREVATEEEMIIITDTLININVSDKVKAAPVVPQYGDSALVFSKKDINFEKEYNDGGGIRTRPLLLIVTVPSFFGIGIFLLILCYVTRNGGWCCQLFEVHRVSQISLKESEQLPAPKHRRTINY